MVDAIKERCEIKFGCTRMVFLVGAYAIKLPILKTWKHFLLGLIANMQERDFSAAGWPELCPVAWAAWGGWLVVMRRARPLSMDEWEAFEPTVREGWLVGQDYYVPCEVKRNSFGMFNGRVVALDYGN